jgi:hypothetical protein
MASTALRRAMAVKISLPPRFTHVIPAIAHYTKKRLLPFPAAF